MAQSFRKLSELPALKFLSGLNIYDGFIAGCLLISVLAVPVAYTRYLGMMSENTVGNFKTQNMRELESGDMLSLVSRLNAFSTSINWVCLSTENSGRTFFSRTQGNCAPSFFKRHVSISPLGNQNLRIDMTLRLPRALEIAFVLILSFQMLSLGLIYWGGKKAGTLRYQRDVDISNMAIQVAHDIRSPLAALGAAAKGLDLPEEQRKLLEGAVGRMQGIADDLLNRYRAPSAVQTAAKQAVHLLGRLIEQVLAEKRLQHKDKTGVKIEFNGAAGELKALVEPKELQRLLSNLVNNSVEAFEKDGTVIIGLSAPDGKVLIEVKDNGKGIPPEILAKLGQKGETHGKANGNGLGLYHARTAVEGWGGNLRIESAPGTGTAVIIELPRAKAAGPAGLTVLLDDDMLVHMNWKTAARAAGVEFKAYKTPQDFAAGISGLPKDTAIYIDSELGSGIKGEDIAKDLHEKGFANITMATGHSPEQFSHLPWLKVAGKEPPWAG